MDGDLYDLLVGHEIGHALYTPEQGWHDAVTQNNKKSFKGFLNVIEDARIEKLAKRKYPGLGKSFAAGYKELYERDLFGIKKLPDVNKLNLIDRINIRFKVGAHVIVKFSDAEMEYVREIEAVETWEQVEDIANRVYAYVKENESDKLNSQTDLDQLINDLKEQLEMNFQIRMMHQMMIWIILMTWMVRVLMMTWMLWTMQMEKVQVRENPKTKQLAQKMAKQSTLVMH
jgi:hypothetical protein